MDPEPNIFLTLSSGSKNTEPEAVAPGLTPAKWLSYARIILGLLLRTTLAVCFRYFSIHDVYRPVVPAGLFVEVMRCDRALPLPVPYLSTHFGRPILGKVTGLARQCYRRINLEQ
jgi:hypothetical protein